MKGEWYVNCSNLGKLGVGWVGCQAMDYYVVQILCHCFICFFPFSLSVPILLLAAQQHTCSKCFILLLEIAV